MTVINTNIAALRAQSGSRMANAAMRTAMERLSTGKRINSAKDDAAGLAIASRMTSQVKGLAVAIRNANDGISLAQTAEGAMGEVTNMLQRMKELAVQSANGTLGTSERAALQVETQQLIAQINDLSKSTNFNGVNLLDGSVTNLQLQTGVRAGDTIALSLKSLSTTQLGTGNTAGVAATGAFEATAANLATNWKIASSDLVINGVAVPASNKTDDTVSSNNGVASAVAKAKAINSVSAQTGVQAIVGKTVMTGTTMTAAALTGTVTINGVTTASITTTTDASESRQKTVAAINLISGQTGVVATDSGDDKAGIVLTAADGRNIEVSLATLTAAATGLKVGAQSGSFNLVSNNGQPIVIGSAASGQVNRSGLVAGSYAAGSASVSTDFRAVATAASGATTLANGDLVINGKSIRSTAASDDTVSDTTAASSKKAASAIALAAAINAASADTGVTATANAVKLQAKTTTAGTAVDAELVINGVSVNIKVATTDTADDIRANTIAKINSISGRTGVVASDEGLGGVTLTGVDGRNVSLYMQNAAAAETPATIGLGGMIVAGSGASVTVAADTATALPATAATVYGTVSLSSAKAINVKAGSPGSGAATNYALLGFEENSYGMNTGGMSLADVDLSTIEGANSALGAIDKALDQISSSRGELGAIQNRLEVTVNSLSTASTNLQDARSRIEDADFSAETTNLAKNQILSQAATAMLAQANQSAQDVLTLLR